MSSRTTKFENLLEAVPDALVGVDHAGVIRFVNHQTESLFGYDRSDLIGAPLEILVPEALRTIHEVHREGYVAAPSTRTMGQDLEPHGRRRDGTLFPMDCVLSHTDTQDGPLVIAAVRDITGHKKAEDAHQKSKQLAAIDVTEREEAYEAARSMIESSQDSLVAISPEGLITDANEATVNVTGVPREELIGTPFSDYFTDPEKANEIYQKVFGDGMAGDYPLTLRHRDGSVTEVLYNASVHRGVRGKVLAVFAAARDVTRLNEALESARSLIESSQDSLVAISPEGLISDLNEATVKVTGVPREELVGTPFSDYFTDPERANAVFQKVFTQESAVEFPLTIRHRDGTLTEVLYNASVYRSPGGKVLAVFAASRDVTRLTEALEAARSMIESSLDSLVAISPEGMITDANEATVRVTGVPREELIGTAFSDYFTEPEKANAIYQLVFDQGMAVDYPLTMRHRGGTLTEVQYNASVYRDAGGKVVGVFAAARDVTEARQAFEAAQRLAAIVESTDDAIIGTTLEGVVTGWNAAAERMLGYSSGQIMGKSSGLLHDTDQAELRTAALARIAAGEHVDRFEAMLIRKDGTRFPASCTLSGVPGADGGVVGASLIARDLTEQVQKEGALAEASRQYRLLAENASDLVVMTSPDRVITWVSPSLTRSLGWAVEDLMGNRLLDLVHPDDAAATAGPREALYSGGEVNTPAGGFLMRFRTKAGPYRWMAGVATPVTDESGVATGVVSGLRDVDDLVRAREEAQADRATLRATLDSLMDPHVLFEAIRDEHGQIIDFVYVDANPAACAYNQMTYQELVGSRLLTLLPAHLGAGLLETYAHVVETGQPLRLDDYVYPQELMSGDERHYDIRAARVGDGLSYTWRDVTDRNLAAARLAASQEQYRLLAENASDLVFMAGPDGQIGWIAPSVTGALGWDPEELKGTSIADLFRPEYKISTAQDRVEFYTNGHDVNPEGGYLFELRTKSGDYCWMSGHGHALTDPDGTPAGVVAGLRDVNELMKARQAAQTEKTTLRATLDSLMDPHALYEAVRDEAGRLVDLEFVYANPAACAYFDMDSPDLIGKRLLDLFHGHVEAGLFEQYAQVVETGAPLILDDFLYNLGLLQAERRYDIRAARVGDGLSISWRDVTERHEAHEYGRRMASVVEQTHDAIIGVSFPDTLVTSWNRSAERMYGYTPEEVIGKTLLLLAPKDQFEQAKGLMAQLSTGEPVVDLETVRLRKDGTEVPVSISSSPIRDAHGVVIGVSTTHRDITQEKAAREEAQALTSALKTSNDSLLDFVAVASHDLRSPLVTIGGFTKILTDNWATLSDEARLKQLGAIQRGVDRLSRLTNDLLASAKVEAAAEQAQPEHIRLATALASYLEANREELGTVAVTCPPELVAVIDPAHLTRILDNYLTNAFKYGEPPISIEAERVGDFVELRVRDHGPGVPPEFVSRLFTKFGRVVTPTTRARQGTGLGLSIVKALAEANHGDARYQQDEPEGGCFVVRLPAAVAE